MTPRRATTAAFIAVGLAVAAVFALVVSPHGSSQPDGLERVAIDQGFADSADDHALADGPLADYAVSGVDDPKLSTGLAGVIGVGLCFAACGLALLAVRRVRSRRKVPPTVATG